MRSLRLLSLVHHGAEKAEWTMEHKEVESRGLREISKGQMVKGLKVLSGSQTTQECCSS